MSKFNKYFLIKASQHRPNSSYVPPITQEQVKRQSIRSAYNNVIEARHEPDSDKIYELLADLQQRIKWNNNQQISRTQSEQRVREREHPRPRARARSRARARDRSRSGSPQTRTPQVQSQSRQISPFRSPSPEHTQFHYSPPPKRNRKSPKIKVRGNRTSAARLDALFDKGVTTRKKNRKQTGYGIGVSASGQWETY